MSPKRTRVWISSACLLAAMFLLSADSASGKQQEQDGTKADVMFVLDITATMQFAIDGVEQGLESILKKLKGKEKIDARVGLTVFRDRDHEKGGNGKATKNDKDAGIKTCPFTFKFKDGEPFTSKQKEFTTVVNKIKAEGGGDLPENSLEALKHAAEAKTRNKVTRVMILITDDEPHPGKTLDKRIENARKALLDHKYHHLHLVTRKEDRALYEKLWAKEKGHVVDGKWFAISNQPKAFAGILDEIAEQAHKDIRRWAKSK